MKIEYDKASGALYLRLREGKPDHAEDLSEKADVYAQRSRIIELAASYGRPAVQSSQTGNRRRTYIKGDEHRSERSKHA